MILLQLMADKFDPKNPATWSKTNVKPTEALTNVGQAARGLAKSKAKNRFKSNAKTPVYDDISGPTLRGTGTPLNSSIAINPLNKKQIAAAAITAISNKPSGQVSKAMGVRADAKYVAERARIDSVNKARMEAADRVRTSKVADRLTEKAFDQSKTGKLTGEDLMDIGRRARQITRNDPRAGL